MIHPAHHVALAGAGIATMNGGSRRGMNALIRSGRQERRAAAAEHRRTLKALRKEVDRILAEVSRVTGEPVTMDMGAAYLTARMDRDPIFAAASERIFALGEVQRKLFNY